MRDRRSRSGDVSQGITALKASRVRRRLIATTAVAIGCAWSLTAAAVPSGKTVAMLPMKLLDTSAEPTDQVNDHTRRLEVMGNSLAADLSKAGVYNVVEVTAADLKKNCPSEDAKCLLQTARQAGASYMLIGVVHKSSSLIMQLFMRLYDVKTEKEIFSRDLNFRGDNDESWRRAEVFLADQFVNGAHDKEAKAPH
ncbi:DUF2380 domain-containing protein [Methylobacterium sp. R2-1]|uniref:DUF2380 domain-containing protein n=1 Tax=Methylobacterium sp. R2-1 TaxID=2587064 RepID=UPI0018109F52|nr:DUF2380 domain-containing protein [Methylobacterium sp. R2-1]MBB2964262.1 hypothetical protein [Methylobacterium sp. R2-1]